MPILSPNGESRRKDALCRACPGTGRFSYTGTFDIVTTRSAIDAATRAAGTRAPRAAVLPRVLYFVLSCVALTWAALTHAASLPPPEGVRTSAATTDAGVVKPGEVANPAEIANPAGVPFDSFLN